MKLSRIGVIHRDCRVGFAQAEARDLHVIQREMLPGNSDVELQFSEDVPPAVLIDVALHDEYALRRGEADRAQIGVDRLDLLGTIRGPGLQIIAGGQYDIRLLRQRFLAHALFVRAEALGLQIGNHGDPQRPLDFRTGDFIMRNLQPKRFDQKGIARHG